jgi:hypothetical protein
VNLIPPALPPRTNRSALPALTPRLARHLLSERRQAALSPLLSCGVWVSSSLVTMMSAERKRVKAVEAETQSSGEIMFPVPKSAQEWSVRTRFRTSVFTTQSG